MARKYALNNTCGDYVTFIDSDDIFTDVIIRTQ